jgi:antirestriction protein ArdC
VSSAISDLPTKDATHEPLPAAQRFSERTVAPAESHALFSRFTSGLVTKVRELCALYDGFSDTWKRGATGMPVNPYTGISYYGANMAVLLLETAHKGYVDNRWMTSVQLEKYRSESRNYSMRLKSDARGVQLLLPVKSEISLSGEGCKGVLFAPFTVFNCSQIANFPEQCVSEPRRDIDKVVQEFAACLGVQVIRKGSTAFYSYADDVILLPAPQAFGGKESCAATFLRECFFAVGKREGREKVDARGELSSLALEREELRAVPFSLMAATAFGVPFPGVKLNSCASVKGWLFRLGAWEKGAIFRCAAETTRAVNLFGSFRAGISPRPEWFPAKERWPGLIAQAADVEAAALRRDAERAEELPVDFNGMITVDVVSRHSATRLIEKAACVSAHGQVEIAQQSRESLGVHSNLSTAVCKSIAYNPLMVELSGAAVAFDSCAVDGVGNFKILDLNVHMDNACAEYAICVPEDNDKYYILTSFPNKEQAVTFIREIEDAGKSVDEIFAGYNTPKKMFLCEEKLCQGLEIFGLECRSTNPELRLKTPLVVFLKQSSLLHGRLLPGCVKKNK